jgi:uncharacterized protein YndB with AHSA1/START domain
MTTTKQDKPFFVYVTYIATTPEKVWAALMDGEMSRQYWGVHRNVSDWKVGSRWTHEDCDTGAVAVEGTVVESDPPRRLVLTWQSPQAPEGARPSRVTFEIQAFMGSVKLTVTHDEIEPESEMAKGVTQGWPAILSSLKSMLETGKPLAMTTQRWGRPPEKA